jgi:hypothetical protein
MAPKKRKVLEEVFDFSEWALQDIVKAPLPSVSASDPPPMRWLGMQSLANIATGRDGKVVVCDAVKRGLHFALGYVEGRRQETHVVMPLDAPRAVANLFSNELAKKVLKAPSFLARLKEAGGGNLGLGVIIDQILAELDVCTPEEFDAMKAFCATCGFGGDDKLPLRVSRVDGEVVMALIDAVMLAKKCTYAAAQHICQRLLLDYWNFDTEASGRLEQPDFPSRIFHSIRLQEGSHGGRATICVGAACLAEVLILIPGCELSTQLRKDMVKSFFGVGGNQVTFESLMSNPRIQAHLRGSDHPLGEFLEDGEHKVLMRTLPRLLLQRDEDRKERDLSSPLPEALPAALPEVCLDWIKDFAVSRQELRGVQSQFKAILSSEISAGQLPRRSPVDLWTKAPPLRFREMAVGAVSSFKSLGRRYGAVAVGDAERVGRRPNEGSESDAEDDILKISDIMSTAGVWQAVWPGYRSDLANQMLSLKCAETGASFSARRPEIVQGHIHVLVHKYKKTDWPLAWTALQNTRDLYEKRVREFLEDMFRMADRPADESSLLARGIAARLRVAA